MARLANTIEAILYLKARPLTLAQLAELAGCDRDATEEGLIELMGDYAHRDSALENTETENGYCLQLKPPFKPLVEELIPLEIGLGALRTLAAIARSGTISQTDLVELRGSGAYQHVPELIDQGMVRKRRQSDGRSFWLHVTEKFYQRFEIDKLPKITLPKKAKPAKDPEDSDASAEIAEASETAIKSTENPSSETTAAATTDGAATETASADERTPDERTPVDLAEDSPDAIPADSSPSETPLSASTPAAEAAEPNIAPAPEPASAPQPSVSTSVRSPSAAQSSASPEASGSPDDALEVSTEIPLEAMGQS